MGVKYPIHPASSLPRRHRASFHCRAMPHCANIHSPKTNLIEELARVSRAGFTGRTAPLRGPLWEDVSLAIRTCTTRGQLSCVHAFPSLCDCAESTSVATRTKGQGNETPINQNRPDSRRHYRNRRFRLIQHRRRNRSTGMHSSILTQTAHTTEIGTIPACPKTPHWEITTIQPARDTPASTHSHLSAFRRDGGTEFNYRTHTCTPQGTGKTGTLMERRHCCQRKPELAHIAKPAAGDYTIEATTYDVEATGNFTLTVSGLPASSTPTTTPTSGVGDTPTVSPTPISGQATPTVTPTQTSAPTITPTPTQPPTSDNILNRLTALETRAATQQGSYRNAWRVK